MKKIFTFLLCCLAAVIFSSCSNDTEDKAPGPVQRMTDKVAEQAVQSIQQPLDQAKQAQAIINAHNDAVEKAVKNNE